MNTDDYKKIKKSIKTFESKFGMNDNQETKTALEMSERDIESYADNFDACEPEKSNELTWSNGETAYVVNSTHDEIIFIGLANNKAVAVCECITSERKVILDKFWISDLLKEKPLTPEQKKANEIIAWEGFFHEISLTEIAGILVDNNIIAPEKYRKQ